MSSSQDFAEFVREQIASAGEISYRKMFGEYCFYCNQKTVALVCDNQLFIKPTPIGRELLKSPVEKPPYEGAKNWFLIDDLENKDFLSSLIYQTYLALPANQAKKKKAAKNK